MKIPIKWLKEYVDIPEDLKEFTDKMSMIGHMLDKTEIKDNDTVVDLELRGNRADCYSIIGIARESHASFGGRFDIPKPKYQLTTKPYTTFKVEVETPAVTRFFSTVIRNIKIGPSPEWMQEKLRNYGMEPINNIVDITNYVMVETGMPMHAFDLNRMNGKKLILRQAAKDEKVVSFDGTNLKLTDQDIVFGAEDGSVLGVAGIVGGKESGIHDDTNAILLECAAYNRVCIRKTMHKHNIQTEAGLRHSHDLHDSLCDYALERAVSLVLEFATDSNESNVEGIDDNYLNIEKPKTIEFNINETTRLGGIQIPIKNQAEILKRLEFEVSQVDENKLNVTFPLFRTDIFESADLVEEILRIFGYENIPSSILSSQIPEPLIQKEIYIEEKTKDVLTSLGLNELITVPFVTKESLEKTKDENASRSISILNPPTSEHTHLRTNMFVTLLDAAKKVIDRGDESFAFFEVGKIYLKKDKEIHQEPHKKEFPYMEIRKVAALVYAKDGSWDFYRLKGLVEDYLYEMHLYNVKFVKVKRSPYELCADVIKNDVVIGNLGIIDEDISLKNFDIKGTLLGFRMDIDEIKKIDPDLKMYTPYSEYPTVKQDMSILVDRAIQAGDIKELIEGAGSPFVIDVLIADVFKLEDKKSILFKITYQSKDKTLSSEEVNKIHIDIESQIVSKFNAVIRGRVQETNQVDLNYGKIIIGEVLSIDKHPNADKLVVCMVNIGNSKSVQIVTGASNMKIGDKVPVALPGIEVPGLKDENGQSIVMKVAKLRGIESHGMMLAEDELGIGTDHDGLFILPNDKKTGEIFQ